MVDFVGILQIVGIIVTTLIGNAAHKLLLLFTSCREKKIKNDVVLITGAGGGIGSQLAIAFARRGARLALLDIDQKSLDRLLREVIKYEPSVEAKAYRCDITSLSAVTDTVACVVRDFGAINILVNNAGVIVGKPLWEHTESDVEKTLNVNTKSHFWTLKAVLPRLFEQESGIVIAIVSGAAHANVPCLSAYAASKCAVLGLMNSLRFELDLAKRNIQVTCVFPDIVRSGMNDSYLPATRREKDVLHPAVVAEEVVEKTLKGKQSIFIPDDLEFLARIQGILPMSTVNAIYKFLGLLTLDAVE